MNLKEGSCFGDYTVVRRLGKGGMGEVWLLQSASGGLVAAKILDPEAGSDHESRKRFLREAELALGVKHPNLVETYDVGEDPETGLCYILMEYVSGGTLADYLRVNGAMAIGDAVAVVEAMASVLELGRQKGIVHRDIKPANIMFAADGTPKLADLGIARGGIGGTDTTTVTRTGVMIGTPAYMSPEQMLDSHNVDTRADIYSLGVVFFEMLTGERPNKDDTIVQLMAKAMKGEPLPDVRTLRPEVSASLAQLLNMMVAPDRDGRISTPGQITNALAIIERGGKFEADTVQIRRQREEKREALRQRRQRERKILGLTIVGVSLFAIVSIGAAVYWLGIDRESPPVRSPRTGEVVQENDVRKRDADESDVKPDEKKSSDEKKVVSEKKVSKDDFKIKLTGVAVVENGAQASISDDAYVPPTSRFESAGRVALFRFAYDFPKDYQARICVLNWQAMDKKGRPVSFLFSQSPMYQGRGVATGRLVLGEAEADCELKEIQVSIMPSPRLHGAGSTFLLGPFDVNVCFLQNKPKAKAEASVPKRPVVDNKRPVIDGRVRTAAVGGYGWCYTLEDNKAVIWCGANGYNNNTLPAIRPNPRGHVEVPSVLDGHPVVAIGHLAFIRCNEMTSITIPEGVERIERAFLFCNALKTVKMPNSLRALGWSVFDSCDALERLDLGNCARFDGLSFGACKNLSRVTVSQSRSEYKTVDDALYADDGRRLVFWPRNRVDMQLPDYVETIGPGAFSRTLIKSVILPKSVVKIESGAFSYCFQLREAVMNEGIAEIGKGAFTWCWMLQRVVFPASLKRLGHSLFRDNSKLKVLAFRGNAPTLIDGNLQSVLGKTPETLEIVVLEGSTGWKTEGSTELPRRWPDEKMADSRPIRAVSKAEMERMIASESADAEPGIKTAKGWQEKRPADFDSGRKVVRGDVANGQEPKADKVAPEALPLAMTHKEVEERLKSMKLAFVSFKPPAMDFDAVDFFQRETGLNFVGRGSGALVPTITLRDILAGDALKLICEGANDRYEVRSNIVFVMPKNSECKWVSKTLPNEPAARILKKITIPKFAFRPPATLADLVDYLREVTQGNGHTVNWVLKTGTGGVPVLPLMTLRQVSAWDALDVACQCCGMGVEVNGNMVIVQPASMMKKADDGKPKSKFTPQQIKRMRDPNGWHAMRKATEVMFPEWRMCDRLKSSLPNVIQKSVDLGYVRAKGGAEDVLATYGEGDILEMKDLKTIRKNCELRFSVCSSRSVRVSLKGMFGNQVLMEKTIIDSHWSTMREVAVDLSEYAGLKMRLTLTAERTGFGADSGGFANVYWSGLEIRNKQ